MHASTYSRSPLRPPMLSPGLVLPTPSFQDQIHELAKTLPPPRKQNTACDACRSVAFPPYPHRTHNPSYQGTQGQVLQTSRSGQGMSVPSYGTALLSTSTLPPPSVRSVASVSSPLFARIYPPPPRSLISTACRKITPARPCFFPPLSNQVTSSDAHRHYVQQATSEKKRNGAARRPRGISTSSRFVYTSSHRISCSAASHPRACWCHMVPFAVILPVLPGRLFDRQSIYPQNLNISVLAIPPWKTAYSPGPDLPGEPP